VAAQSVQLAVAGGITSLYIDTDGQAGPAELVVRLAGGTRPAISRLSGGFIRYVPYYNVTGMASPVGAGSVVLAGQRARGGSSNRLATAQTGYKFQHWSGACSGSACAPSQIGADVVATAVFIPTTVNTGPGRRGRRRSGSSRSCGGQLLGF
jgi:hypothetical protein